MYIYQNELFSLRSSLCVVFIQFLHFYRVFSIIFAHKNHFSQFSISNSTFKTHISWLSSNFLMTQGVTDNHQSLIETPNTFWKKLLEIPVMHYGTKIEAVTENNYPPYCNTILENHNKNYKRTKKGVCLFCWQTYIDLFCWKPWIFGTKDINWTIRIFE